MSCAELPLRAPRQLTGFWPVAASAVAGVTITFLGFYNGLAWSGLFASVAAVLADLSFY
ncbi:hypothetical protein WKI65_21195 [Streptomyces sp. MS1.AVA.3]|uniref:hypothetical protein n=1 Tax=Streptomyces decoyicus TaxID=249567 RepID=UPI0030C3F296